MNIAVAGVNVDTAGRAFQVFVRRDSESDEALLRRSALWIRLMGSLSNWRLAFRLYAVEADDGRMATQEISRRYGE